MRLPLQLWVVIGLVASAACGSSHTPDEDGGPTDGGSAPCAAPPPTCYVDLGGGCCGEEVDAVCTAPVWSCPGLEASACTAHTPECGADCASLNEAECIGSPECGPLYDDYCCPLCLPIGACADCTQPQMYSCGPIAGACASDPPVCGLPTGWACRGGTADCSAASPVTGGRCDVPGCVQAIEPGCADDCPVTCVPVTGVSCTASCEIVPPPCPMGFVNEGDGSCYTGLCIAESACMPAQPVGP